MQETAGERAQVSSQRVLTLSGMRSSPFWWQTSMILSGSREYSSGPGAAGSPSKSACSKCAWIHLRDDSCELAALTSCKTLYRAVWDAWLLPYHFCTAVQGHLLGAFHSETPRPLLCRLKDADLIGAPTMGVVSFPVQKLVEGEVFDGWFNLLDLANKPLKGCAIRATLSFRQDPSPASDRCIWLQRLRSVVLQQAISVLQEADWTLSCFAAEMRENMTSPRAGDACPHHSASLPLCSNGSVGEDA